jgi:N-glycosylase/DNA lyase
MAQTITSTVNGKTRELLLPDCDEEVLPGIKWGHHYATFTPSFWASLAWFKQVEAQSIGHRIGETLAEEITACLLGGHGIPAEVGLAAFRRLREQGLLKGLPVTKERLCEALSVPLILNDRQVRYRFALQRSKYVSEALTRLAEGQPPYNDLAFRNWLLEFRGVGPKTASWITRNWLNSEKVAIIDIHIYRAGLLIGLFSRDESPARHYFQMEQKFLDFASNIGVRASCLDALIWRQMKDAGSMIFKLLK